MLENRVYMVYKEFSGKVKEANATEGPAECAPTLFDMSIYAKEGEHFKMGLRKKVHHLFHGGGDGA